MKIEIEVGSQQIEALARERLTKAGLDHQKFKMKSNLPLHGGERGDGNIMAVRYYFEDK